MSNPYEPPNQPTPPQFRPAAQGDATGGLIPYKNGPALTAYYLSIGTMLCCITPLPLGFIPMVLGIMGLRKRAREPEVKGSVHAWIGIILGGASGLVSLISIPGWIALAVGGIK
jgi:hypothetical protein